MIDPYTRISTEKAVELVVSTVSELETEHVDLVNAVGRVVSEDLTSDIDIAPFDNVAMDGFALKASQIKEATPDKPVKLKVVAEVPCGSYYDGGIADDECVRIMTGAPLPACCDCMVQYEKVDYLGTDGREGATVAFSAPVEEGNNIRKAGEDIEAGAVAIAQHETVKAAGVGFLASCGITSVPVYRRPKVGVISIGSELVEPTELPTRGKIRNSNGYALEAQVAQAGGIPQRYPIVEDTLEALTAQVLKASEECDFVVTSGGASNGDFDFIKPVIENNGKLLMTLVNMRPGKCQTFGLVNGTPVFGLPGNPAAAWCGFEIIIRQALRKMQGYTSFARPQIKAHLNGALRKKNARRMYLRATLERVAGELVVTPASNQSSGLASTQQRSTCLIVKPEGTIVYENGDLVDVLLMDVEEGTVL